MCIGSFVAFLGGFADVAVTLSYDNAKLSFLAAMSAFLSRLLVVRYSSSDGMIPAHPQNVLI